MSSEIASKTFLEKNGTLVQKIIVRKFDTGDNYESGRYTEFEQLETPEIGKKYFVWIAHYVGPNRDKNSVKTIRWNDDNDQNVWMIENGMGGNSNKNITRFHGWRGTTDDNYVCAYGVRVCDSVIRTEYKKTVHYKIVMGVDLKQNRD